MENVILPPAYEALVGKGVVPPQHDLAFTEKFFKERLERKNLEPNQRLYIERFLTCLRKGVFQKEQCGCWADVSSDDGLVVCKTLTEFWEKTPRKNVEYFHITLGIKPLSRT